MNKITHIKDIIYGIRILALNPSMHSITVFCTPLSNVKERVRITRNKSNGSILINVGCPNYREREFLRDCKKVKTNPNRYLLWGFPKKRK